MSSLFYIWDAAQHHPEVSIQRLEQAEYYATHSQTLGLTDQFKNWLRAVEAIVTKPELAVNFDEEIISFFSKVERYFDLPENVFAIEQGLVLKSKYLYRVLVETLRAHHLVAFDARSYIFFSRDQIFPDQQDVQRMLDAIQPVTQQQLDQFQAIPPDTSRLTIFAEQWVQNNQETLHFIEQRKKTKIIKSLDFLGGRRYMRIF